MHCTKALISPGCARPECRRSNRHCRFADARLGAALALFSIGVLSTYGVGFNMFLIAFLLFVGAFGVTQIASETKGLALDVIAPLTRRKGEEAQRGRGKP